MNKTYNFLFFWFLLTYAIGQGDAFGMLLACLGFLFFFGMLEDLDNERY